MTNYVTKPIPSEKPPVKRVSRPWGSFSQYAFNEEVTVSLMTVEPNQRLSLQSHTGRGELWIVFDEGAVVEVDDKVYHPRVWGGDLDSGQRPPPPEQFWPARARFRGSLR